MLLESRSYIWSINSFKVFPAVVWNEWQKKKMLLVYNFYNKSPANLDKLDICWGGGGFLTGSIW